MSAEVTLNLSDKIYERVQSFASLRQQDIGDALIKYLDETLPTLEVAQSSDTLRTRQSEALAREEIAYIKLHPQLKETHFGDYIAIYNGKLIDEDQDLGSMIERVRSKLPNQIVLMTKVGDEPTRTIMRRGNRMIRDGE